MTYALLPNHDRQAHSLGLPNTWVRTDNNQGADPFDDGDHVGRELERELRESHSQHVSAGDLSNEKEVFQNFIEGKGKPKCLKNFFPYNLFI